MVTHRIGSIVHMPASVRWSSGGLYGAERVGAGIRDRQSVEATLKARMRAAGIVDIHVDASPNCAAHCDCVSACCARDCPFVGCH